MGTSYNPKIVTDGLVLNLDPANVKSYPANQDPFVNNVSLMLAMDGVNNSTTFTDSSQNALAATRFGTPVISTTQSKFGGSSAYFNGTSDYITYSSATLFDFSGDFTVEGWWYFLQVNQVQGYSIMHCTIELDKCQLATVGGAIQFYWNGSLLINYAYTVANLLNTWTHVAITRSGSTITMWLNGVNVASATSSASIDVSGLSLGKQLNNGIYNGYFNGYIDDFRVTKAARYTANFTPPTAPLSLPGRLTDLTKNRSIATLTNGPTYSGGNLVFDGTNDYMVSPTSTLFNFATGDFTVEMWVYPTSVKTFSLLDFRINETNPNGNAFVIGTSASNLWVVYQNGNQITGPTVVANQWTQVVVNRVGTAVKMFLNGAQIGSTWTTSNSFTDGAFVLGTDYPLNARFFQGNLSSVKIYKGKGLSNNEILQNYNATKGRFGI